MTIREHLQKLFVVIEERVWGRCFFDAIAQKAIRENERESAKHNLPDRQHARNT